MLDSLTRDDLPDSVMDIVDSIGLDAFKELVRLAGGSNLYIPNESSLVKSFRNKKIREVFDGDYKVISRKLVRLRLEILLIISKLFLNGGSLLIDASHKLFVLG